MSVEESPTPSEAGAEGPEGPAGSEGPENLEVPEVQEGSESPEGPEGPEGPENREVPEGPEFHAARHQAGYGFSAAEFLTLPRNLKMDSVLHN